MVKLHTVFRCTACTVVLPKWIGRCSGCGEWNTLTEEVESDQEPIPHFPMANNPSGVPEPINSTNHVLVTPVTTTIDELDRILGGGLVPGSVTLLGGEPGIGKSTLLLQLLAKCSGTALYVTAEESGQQVRLRANRLNSLRPNLWLLAENSLYNILDSIKEIQPNIVVIDSIQAIANQEIGSAPGSVVQVRECTNQLVQIAKKKDLSIILVGHVTKDGTLAGPRILEHVVDTVLSFEGDRHHALRLLRVIKHRFGSTNELGIFQMTEHGLQAVPDASIFFLADRHLGVPGSVVVPTLEGHRPLLVEVQALTNHSPTNISPRRSAQGVDSGRLAMLLAVLHRRACIDLSGHEVFVSVVGGIRLSDPGADLGTCLSLVSATKSIALPGNLIACGEVGLAGELRQVAHMSRRLAEAARIGFSRAIIPTSSASIQQVPGLKLELATTLVQALDIAGLS